MKWALNQAFQQSRNRFKIWLSKESACNAGDLGLIPGFDPWVQSLGQEDPLEKRMATHSSILAWRISQIEESGGVQSMGLQRIRH